MKLFNININTILFAFLMSFRFGALFISMPIFSELKPPVLIRIILPISLALLVAPLIEGLVSPILTDNVITYFLAIFTEVAVGLIMGYSIQILFMLSGVVGEFMGVQMGFNLASVFDPNLGQGSQLAIFFKIFLIFIFISLDLHLDLIRFLAKSYEAIPVGTDFLSLSTVVSGFMKLFTLIYILAVRLTLPILLVIFLLHIMMGIVSITAPQMNMYFNVALSMNVVIGLLIVSVSLSTIAEFFVTSSIAIKDFFAGYLLMQ